MKYTTTIISLAITLTIAQAQPYPTQGLQCGAHGESGCEQYISTCADANSTEITFWFDRDNWSSNYSIELSFIDSLNRIEIPTGTGFVSVQTCIPQNQCIKVEILVGSTITVPPNGYGIHIQGDTLTGPQAIAQTGSHYIGSCCTDLTINPNTQGISCNGYDDGQISLLVQGGLTPYQINWSDGRSYTTILNNLAQGNYQATVTDALGCTQTVGQTVLAPNLLTATISATLPTTPEGTDGTATVSTQGGIAPYTYQWSTNANTPTISGLTTGSYEVLITDANACNLTLSTDIYPLEVALKLYLEGPLDTFTYLMSDDLRTVGINPLIPSTQPYDQAGFGYLGTETVSNNVLQIGGSRAVVDWVWVQVRSDLNNRIASKAGLLLRDGNIVSEDGVSKLLFENLLPESYHIAVYHRNHLSAITPELQTADRQLIQYNFTVEDAYVSPNGIGYGQKPMAAKYALFSGDIDQVSDPIIGDITGQDGIYWSAQNGNNNFYLSADLNLDGDVNGFDRILWSVNNGISNRVTK